MADFALGDLFSRNMDAYLINPTIKTEDDFDLPKGSRLSGDSTQFVLPKELSRSKSGKQRAEPLMWTGREISTENIFAKGYTSDEELASPTENDDSGFAFTSSDTDSTLSLRETPSLEQLSEAPAIVNAVQLCTKAQAVQLVSAGKPKVVSVSKSVDLGSNGSSPRFAKDASWEPSPVSSNSPSRSSSGRSAVSPVSPAIESFPLPPQISVPVRRKSLIQPLKTSGTMRSNRAQTPLADQKADFLKHDPFPSTWDLPASPPTTSTPKRRVSKLSSSFSLKNIGKPRRNNDSTDSSASSELDYLRYTPTIGMAPLAWPIQPSTPRTVPSNPTPSSPRRVVSNPLPKMIPRGANERERPLVLPPCPADYNDDWDVPYPYPSRRPGRRDTTSDDSSFETPSALKHLRRKSVSAAYVTARA